MRLEAYLKAKDIKPVEFAGRVGVAPSTIYRLLNGERSPGLPLLQSISKATNGEVAPNDILDEPAEAEAGE